MNRLLAGAAALALLGALGLGAQKVKVFAQISGRVVDETGQVCANVHVTANNPDVLKKHWDAVTNPLGEFAINLPVGDATYLVQADGSRHYTADQQQVKIVGDAKTTITLTLHIKG